MATDGDRPAARLVRSSPRVAFTVGLTAVTVLGATIRARSLGAALPYTVYYDEFGIVRPASRLLARGTWDPGFYWYPSLIIYLSAALAKAMSVLGVGGIRSDARATLASPHLEVVGPPELILSARLVVWTASTALITITGLLGRRLAGRRVGLLAAVLAATMPGLVARGSIAVGDTPGATFVALALLATAHLASTERTTRWSLVAGVATGLAFTSKYTPGLVGVAPLVVLAARTDRPLAGRFRLGALVAVSAVGTVLVTMPALVIRPRVVLSALGDLNRFYGRQPTTATYWSQLRDPNEIGTVVLALAALGVVVLLAAGRSRLTTVAALAFGALLGVALLRSGFRPVRNVLPLDPLIAVAAAAGVDGAARASRRVTGLPRVATDLAAVAVVAAVSVAWLTGPVTSIIEGRDVVDTRVRARELLAEHVRAGDRVLVADELAFLPSELARLGPDVEVEVRSQTEPLGDPSRYDFIVRGHLPDHPYAWAILPVDRPTVGSFGGRPASCSRRDLAPGCPSQPAPKAWHQNRVLIVVVGPPAGG